MVHHLTSIMTDEDHHLHVPTVPGVTVASVLLAQDDHQYTTNTMIEGMLVDLLLEETTAHLHRGDMMILTIAGLLHLLQEDMILTPGQIPMQDLVAHLRLVDTEIMALEAIVVMMIGHTRYTLAYLPTC